MENSTKGILLPCADSAQPFLTNLIPDDSVKGKKRENWDTRKNYSVQVKDIFITGEPRHQRQAERINQCSETLFFDWSKIDANGEIKLQFRKAYFCRVRNCPICQWRRSQMWVARFFEALPCIYAAHPTMRYVLLTLTVKNCPITELRATVQNMNKAWQRLSQRKAFPALGFVRSLEVTKETDTHDKKTKKLIHKARSNYCHPHFHIILALPASYFSRNYLSTAKWAELWKEALRIDYTPICDVRLVKLKTRKENDLNTATDNLENAFTAILDDLRILLALANGKASEAVLTALQDALIAAREKDIEAFLKTLESGLNQSDKTGVEAILTGIERLITAGKQLEIDMTIKSLQAAILETIKYTVKPSDMVQDRDWSLALVDQLHKTRAVALGGIFKEFLREEEDDDKQDDSDDQEDQQDNSNGVCFGWKQPVQRYQQLPPKN